MAVRTIRTLGDEILRIKSRKVEQVNERIITILEDMAETMYSVGGLGLAGVQVGILRRLVVIDVGEGLVKLINPEIVKQEGEEVEEEACLSVPEESGYVLRPQTVTVKACNEKGEEVTITAEGLFKKALCHEIDHLDGVLFIDRVLNESELEKFPEVIRPQEGEE